jgi:UDP-glucose:(indol-3-yl)acetate beta-D-glucosyltransferase
MEILKENKEEEIHVLMVAFPSQGHLNPMLRLGKRLVNKGLHVTLATTEFTRHRMLKSSTITPPPPPSQSLESRFASSLMVKA